MGSKKKQWSIYLIAAFSPPGYGTYLPKSFSSPTGTEEASLILSIVGEEIFRTMKFSTQLGPLNQASLYGMFGRRGTKEYSRRKKIPHIAYLRLS